MDRITLEGVAKRFGETQALVDASLDARAGEIHAIVGENGSGKSTLAKVLAGIVIPDSGAVDVLGTTPRSPKDAIAAGVATIFQEILLAESLSVQENLFAGRDGFWRRLVPEGEKRRITQEVLGRLVGAPVDPDALVETLPLSVKQWIVIARALIAEPKVLIFDESSAALDLDAASRLHAEMRRLRDQGCCILLVTHRIAELIRIADAATVLRDGVTVGRLAKHEITEARLLELMSAEPGGHGRSHAVDPQCLHGPERLVARGIRLRSDGPAIDFAIRAGEIVGLTGLDGAGQTELARVLAGIDRPANGSLVATTDRERPIASLRDAENAAIAYVSGDRKREGIFPKLSILENFGMALMRRRGEAERLFLDTPRLDRDFAAERARLSIKLGRGSDRITTLSGGNQQKVLIGRAFAQRPEVIVLNDPARGVDIGTKLDLYRHLREFARAGGAVVYVSSELEEFIGFADRVDVLVDGGIFASLTGEAIEEHRILAALFGRTREVAFEPTSQAAIPAEVA